MDFTFTQEQTMLREALSRFLGQHYTFEKRRRIVATPAGQSPEVWGQLRDMGLLALPLPESAGGLGGSIVDVVAVAELLGQHLVVEPWLASAVLSAGLLAKRGETRLPALLEGEATAAFAYEEGSGTADLAQVAMRAAATATGHVLNGEKHLVLGAEAASVLLVTARLPDGRLGLFLVDRDAPGLSLRSYTTIDGRRAAHCRFEDVAAGPDALVDADAEAAVAGAVRAATLALCAEAVGAMGALLEITASYAGTRKQFGVPIGSFQVIAHRLADMKLAYVKARSLLLYTAALAENDAASPRDVSLLKAQVGRLGRALGESAVQIHGGVGMTDELSVGHYLKRILFVDTVFGPSDYHLQRVGAAQPA
ncbi:acyl-CoA dehydrogenase family protein [Novosphingobium sp. KCTC 2891]|uniref:acyl-CoA dehydrogenase family protein n=1 Tax=Novosphingobium sp. KCTC 2891 TaxID=2989730 RepID=UPI0022222C30|nr:acyl-CoA dehydrogenase family protein [Novosphingobium sp. KCTC 2891]MCW1381622.1 acyl-CoA dehydrogenase family protein [Novosphingobium sp. KCTC 2891]